MFREATKPKKENAFSSNAVNIMQYCRLKTVVSISITMQSFFGQNKRKTAFFALTEGLLILTTRQVLNTNVCTRCQIFGFKKKN